MALQEIDDLSPHREVAEYLEEIWTAGTDHWDTANYYDQRQARTVKQTFPL